MTNMVIVNLTPHTINAHVEGGVVDIPASGMVARVACHRTQAAKLNGIPTYSITYGTVEGFPDPQPDTVYIVSKLVAAAIVARELYPGVIIVTPGSLIRNEQGQPIGCDGFDLA